MKAKLVMEEPGSSDPPLKEKLAKLTASQKENENKASQEHGASWLTQIITD